MNSTAFRPKGNVALSEKWDVEASKPAKRFAWYLVDAGFLGQANLGRHVARAPFNKVWLYSADAGTIRDAGTVRATVTALFVNVFRPRAEPVGAEWWSEERIQALRGLRVEAKRLFGQATTISADLRCDIDREPTVFAVVTISTPAIALEAFLDGEDALVNYFVTAFPGVEDDFVSVCHRAQ